MIKALCLPKGVVRFLFALMMLLLVVGLPMASFAAKKYDLTIHYIHVLQPPGQAAYDVAIYFSVLDQDDKLVKDLEADDFTLTEDGVEKEITSVEPIGLDPISIVLLLDNNSSIQGGTLASIKKAATEFVDDLNRDDSIALVSFNETTEILEDFTTDRENVKDEIDKLERETKTGSCIYDALYEAIEMLARQPAGRRAIIMLTNRKDENYNLKTCSIHTVDDVTDLATAWNTRVPIYTIGLTDGVDEKELERIATLTGGTYRFSEKHDDLSNVFNKLSNQMQNEYVLHFTSTNTSGEHTLVLQVEKDHTKDQESRKIILPVLSAVSATTVPEEATAVEGAETAPQAEATPTSFLPLPTEEAKGVGLELSGMTLLLAVAAVVLIGIIVAVIAAVMIAGRGKQARGRGAAVPPSASPSGRGSEATIDGIVTPAAPLYGAPVGVSAGGQVGLLTVLASDDPMMVGQVITVNAGRTTIGRSAENDIVLPKDKAVSREHAIIEQMGSKIFLVEVVSQQPDGSVKRPTYGTFVNEVQVGSVPVEIKTGDVIRLGNRLKLRFEKFGGDISSDKTIDGFGPSLDATMDGSAPSDKTVEYRP